MNENSHSDIGRAAIDVYLDSVEQALAAANAPRSDRLLVLQDLESQIEEMLAQQPRPLTEEMVQAVIARLEPPSHFAAMYGNGRHPRVAWSSSMPAAANRVIRWSYVAAACFALPLVGIVLEWAVRLPVRHSGAIFVLSILAAVAATPWALAMAYKQVRAESGRSTDRNFVLSMITGYAVVAPAFAMAVLTEWTYGLALVPVGAAGFLYGQYRLVQWLRRYVADGLPPQSGGTRSQGSAPPIGGSMTMAAV